MDSIQYQLSYSRRKTIAIYVSAEKGVEVRAPHHISADQAHQFVLEKQNWIERQLLQLAQRPDKFEPQWQWGSQHYFLGEAQTLHCSPSQGTDYIVSGKPNDDADSVQRRISHWYREQATEVFNERHQHWNEQLDFLDLPSSYIEVRQMKRRWGSCRRNGKITINTHLVKYPLECVDVVIVHELCHLLEFNHSSRFYQLMSQALPNWKKLDALLNTLSLQY